MYDIARPIDVVLFTQIEVKSGNRNLFWMEVRKIKKKCKVYLERKLNRDGNFVAEKMDVKGVCERNNSKICITSNIDEVTVNMC